jgi:hypothetical protein
MELQGPKPVHDQYKLIPCMAWIMVVVADQREASVSALHTRPLAADSRVQRCVLNGAATA